MTDKERENIRKKISCPQFGDDHYGEWGTLNINQRRTIKRMLDFIDGQENYIKSQQAEIERLKAGVNVDLENYASEYDSKIKAEAIKEFAERLKKHYDEYDDYDDIYVRHIRDDIDFTLDDMIGDENEKDT